MPARNKSELLEITEKEFAKLEKLLITIGTGAALSKDDEETSIKDVIAHRAHWIELFLGWHADGLAGRKVHFPAEGYKWNELKRYNEQLRADQSVLGWAEAVALLRVNYAKLLNFMHDATEQELYGGPMKGAKNDWTTGRWAEAAGPSHFRSATKYLRRRLRELG